MTVMCHVACLLSLALTQPLAMAEGPGAFPGAEGWGADTRGGRGGVILFVTNLADSGPGTLREALETEGPRTILFRVSGIIKLKSTLWLGGRYENKHEDYENPLSFCTIAGQSAPGGGITIAGHPFVISNRCHDVVVRHLRFRDSRDDCVGFYTGCRRVVLDHCSLSWSTDENIGFYRYGTDITVSWCTIAEGMWHGGHVKGGHSMGMLVARGADRVSIHHNLFMSNRGRNPLLCGGNLPKWAKDYVLHPVFDVRNNLIYNCLSSTAVSNGALANLVGNYYRQGPGTSRHKAAIDLTEREDGTKIYIEGNIGPHLVGGDQWSMVRVYSPNVPSIADQYGRLAEMYRVKSPFTAPPVTTLLAKRVPDLVLAQAGALPHDPTDTRLAQEYANGTGDLGATRRTHETPIPPPQPGKPLPDADNDGMPDAWETKHGLNPADRTDAWSDRDGDGLLNLEEYLAARHNELLAAAE